MNIKNSQESYNAPILHDPTISKIKTDPSTLSEESRVSRVENAFGHAFVLVKVLKDQTLSIALPKSERGNTPIESTLSSIYEKAERDIQSLKQKSISGQKIESKMSNRDIKDLKKLIKGNPEKEIVNIIKNAQKQVVKEIAAHMAQIESERKGELLDKKSLEKLKKDLSTLLEGGGGARLLKLSASGIRIKRIFEKAKNLMESSARFELKAAIIQDGKSASTLVDNDRINEFNAAINGDVRATKAFMSRRAGVISLTTGQTRALISFNPKNIAKQLKNLAAQNLSHTKREIISKTVPLSVDFVDTRGLKISRTENLESQIIPLNQSFDEHLKQPNQEDFKETGVFEKTFGKTGISSANRQEAHVVNANLSTAKLRTSEVRMFRHGILSDKFETDPEVRRQNSIRAARELITAALLQEMKEQGVTLDNYDEKEVLGISFTSVSLVTPDLIRKMLNKTANERTMLKDQIQALRAIQREGKIEINGQVVHFNLKLKIYNFGVNRGAVNYKFGLDQHTENIESFKETRREFQSFLSLNLDPKPCQEATDLFKDIEHLMKNKDSYLKGVNQYELQAKLIILENLMSKEFQARGLPGIQSAFNCMSGKDRTGVLDVMIKTLIAMHGLTGRYPSTEELKLDPIVKDLFAITAKEVLLKSGNLEITEINTGAKGLKIGPEAKLWGKELGLSEEETNVFDEAFREAQGLGKTTGA